ncbi:hypothetical protein F444_08061 [Phytophthora nicotianae P1976]|uniref:Uncharacterized protein n=2 Tax=Phytophthora nicotianae TaxID=4792 RepID=A0A081ACH1_PHYNI|nr:hypothetical protein F444_08061 [Phytophthora nicotianae P1976]
MYSWEEALCNKTHASNAKDHAKLKHADHPLAILADQSATEKSKTDVETAETDADAVLDLTRGTGGAVASTTPSPGATTGATTSGESGSRFFRATEKTLNVLISKFLVSQGLPYTLCASEPFKDVIRAATGNPSFAVLGRDKHDRLLNGQFQLFCELVGAVLSTEYENACQLKYLNLMHDIWTSSGKENIVEQESCSMHIPNLCIGYGIGLKDNIQTVTVWNDSTTSWDKVVKIVTPGGALEEGGNVIRKLRNLNNYFRSVKQRAALKKIQEALSYPELEPMTDQDVRVAYTCKLIRSVWTALTAQDWMLAVEMEAVTHFIANLALVETQSENLVSSYMVVFRRLAENKLKAFKFERMAIEAPGAKSANEASHRRVLRTHDQFSDAG